MAFKQFKKSFLNISDLPETIEDVAAILKSVIRTTNILQDNISDSLAPLNAKTQNDSNLLTNIVLKAGQTNVVNHKLTRPLSGWQVVRKRGFADIKDDQDNNTAPNLTLWLITTVDVTVDLLVF